MGYQIGKNGTNVLVPSVKNSVRSFELWSSASTWADQSALEEAATSHACTQETV